MASDLTAHQVITIEWSLVTVSLVFVMARLTIRFLKRQKHLLISDIWLCISAIDVLALVSCDTTSFAHGGMDGNWNKTIAKVNFAGNYFYDVGLYFPKFSILAFYFQIIPTFHRRLRTAMYAITVYAALASVATFLADTVWCGKDVSVNWQIDPMPECTTFSSIGNIRFNWGLNVTIDLMIFLLPFPLLRGLAKLSNYEKMGLIATFGLGFVTVAVSTTRFYLLNTESDATLIFCTSMAELTTAIVVVSLPALRPLLLVICKTGKDKFASMTTTAMATRTRSRPRPSRTTSKMTVNQQAAVEESVPSSSGDTFATDEDCNSRGNDWMRQYDLESSAEEEEGLGEEQERYLNDLRLQMSFDLESQDGHQVEAYKPG